VNPGIVDDPSRRAFLQACGAGLATAELAAAFSPGAPAAPSAPLLRAGPDPTRALVPELSWDTEGGERCRVNLLRKSAGVGVRVRVNGQWRSGIDLPTEAAASGHGIRYRLKLSSHASLLWEVVPAPDRLTMSFSTEGDASFAPDSIELLFPFDPMVTPVTVLPSRWNKDGSLAAPLIISAPDFGQMLLNASPAIEMPGRLEGSRDNHTVDLILGLPQLDANHPCTLSLTPVFLPMPHGLQNEELWRLARRGWFNAFQPSARWGEQNRAFSSPPGILANNVISDPCSLSLMFYADQMLWTPVAAAGISVADLVRRAIEFWLEQRTRSNGEVVGYWDYGNFLDANAGPVIAAWDYVEATGDLGWLEKTIARLEFVSDFLARRDQDGDGLVEATQSGNDNTLIEPDRSCAWMDAVNHGHKDAYSNAIIYRSWRCLADLESKLHRAGRRARYAGLAGRLKAAYRKALYNPQTGWIADWRSADGKLHDYASPVTNGLAISYGLVGAEEGRDIVEKLWAKMRSAGFQHFELGIPLNLDPIRRADYLQFPQPVPNMGAPAREDGSDAFQQYLNGGISGAQTLDFLVAHYLVGKGEAADHILRQMLARQQGIGFQNGVQNVANKGIDIVTWDGKPCGYEGYLADVYYFLMAVPLREPALRECFYKPLASA
jgi:hypothetical protein